MSHIYRENNKAWKIYEDEKECCNNVVYAYLVNESEYDGEEKIDTRFFEITDDDYIEIYQKFSVMAKVDFSKPEGSRAGELFIIVATNKGEDVEIYLVNSYGEHITEIDDYFSLDLPEGFTDKPDENEFVKGFDSDTKDMLSDIKRSSKNQKCFESENAVVIEMSEDFRRKLAAALETTKDVFRNSQPLVSSVFFVNGDGKLELHSTTGTMGRIIKTSIQLPPSFVSMSIPRDVLKYLWQYKNPEAKTIKILGEIYNTDPNDIHCGIMIGDECYSFRAVKYPGTITRVFPSETTGSIKCDTSELKNAVEKLNEQFCSYAKKNKLIEIVKSKKYPDLKYAYEISDAEDRPTGVSSFWGKNSTEDILIGSIPKVRNKKENCVINISQDLFSSLVFSFKGKTIATVPAEIDYPENIEMNVGLDCLNAVVGKNRDLSETVEFKLNALNKPVLIVNGDESTVFMPV